MKLAPLFAAVAASFMLAACQNGPTSKEVIATGTPSTQKFSAGASHQPLAPANTAKPAAAKTPKAAAPASTEPALDEFQKLIRDFNMIPEQAGRINAKRDAFHAGLTAIEDGPIGAAKRATDAQLAEAKKNGQPEAIAAAEASRKTAHTAYMTRRGALRAAVFNELTDEQKLRYTTMRFMSDIQRDFGKAELTDEQLAAIKPLADKAAAEFLKPDTFTTDPYLLKIRDAKVPVEDDIRARILTPEQRVKVAPKPKIPATKPAA